MELIQATRVTKDGKYKEALALYPRGDKFFNLLGQEVTMDETVVFVPLPKGIYTPIWNFGKKVWEEGLSPKEIEDIKNRPDPPRPA
ncbi:hypothetical protein ABNB59_15550 [Paenibacillus larvae]|uniref:hypothetical protein n=1 Tax=Paenibacillus larvae TaxID=1464 RepID=UPI00228237D0|nr:hypothetical protein [Paenibacillus larvae]MCY7476061.1 hypothetical protein [Paenibacillus larvae]MDE5127520.1 hypothetical protein [Paenibacillus larvae subsp. larvae]MDE5135189.1 hypothetical protein [Paenibacillus larvae subsp. larvae]MDE5139870.1 hypothetical protein [Paenibacillus larvae subsp. larvae]MDE5143401.1 hypothetical protein [Paenibacillus larvae subsp. larvae]